MKKISSDKWKRNKTLRLIKKAFGGKDGTSTNKAEKLGNFVAVTKGIAIQCNNYTQDGQDYYICDLAGVA